MRVVQLGGIVLATAGLVAAGIKNARDQLNNPDYASPIGYGGKPFQRLNLLQIKRVLIVRPQSLRRSTKMYGLIVIRPLVSLCPLPYKHPLRKAAEAQNL